MIYTGKPQEKGKTREEEKVEIFFIGHRQLAMMMGLSPKQKHRFQNQGRQKNSRYTGTISRNK